MVVLAERDKVEMDRELRRELGRQPNLEWHTRYGAPHSIADLERVGAGQARPPGHFLAWPLISTHIFRRLHLDLKQNSADTLSSLCLATDCHPSHALSACVEPRDLDLRWMACALQLP